MKHKTMKLMIALMALTTTAQFANAQGSGRDGHGGRSYVCYGPKDAKGKRQPISAKFVDYEEARVLSDWTINLGVDHPGVDDTDAMIDLALARLYKKSPYFADRIRDRLKDIKKAEKFIDLNDSEYILGLIPDAKELIESPTEDCVVRQAAFNKVKVGINNFKYVFVKQYYDLMTDQDRAGLRLHEAIYNLEAENKAENSDGVREFNRAISSDQFEALTLTQFTQLVKDNLKFSYAGYPISFNTDPYFGSDSKVIRVGNQIRGSYANRLMWQNFSYLQLGGINFAKITTPEEKGTESVFVMADFDENGILRRLQVEAADAFTLGGNLGSLEVKVEIEIAGVKYPADLKSKVSIFRSLGDIIKPSSARDAMIFEFNEAGVVTSTKTVKLKGQQGKQ